MSSSISENLQTKSQQNSWQNKQFQRSEINWQNKSQNAHFDDYDFAQEEHVESSENEQNLDESSSVYYDDEEYYDDRAYDEILNTSAKSENIQSVESNQKNFEIHFEEILNEKLAQMTKSLQLTLQCRVCHRKFYSNNKLHRYIRSRHHDFIQVTSSFKKITNISIVISKRDHTDHNDFAFRENQYARVKKVLESNDETHDLCANSETFMSLVDRKFIERFKDEIKITSFKIQMREIYFKTHDTSKYCFFDLYFRERFKEKFRIAHIQKKFHLMNNLNVNMLIDIDIMKFEKCILNFKIKVMTFSFCENIEMLIIIIRID
jgi:ribosomal protein L44E